MTNAEYELVKDFTYLEFVEYLHLKYGEVKGPYFNISKNDSLVTNQEIKRTDEGLFVHHVKEDRAAHLSAIDYAIKHPYYYQKAQNLVYCDYLEHLYLHTLILEDPKGFGSSGHSIGERVYQDLERIYTSHNLKKDYLLKARERIIDDKDVFDLLENRYLSALNKEPKLDDKTLLKKRQVEFQDFINLGLKGYDGFILRINGKRQTILLKLDSVKMNFVNRDTAIKYTKVEVVKRVKKTRTTQTGESYEYYGRGEKTNSIEKNIRLTNERLETLNCDKDPDIAALSHQIIDALDLKTLIPSWYKKEPILKKEEEELEETNDYIEKYETDIKIAPIFLNFLQNSINKMISEKDDNEGTYKKCSKNLQKKFLKIITLNIYPHYIRNEMSYLEKQNKILDEKIKGAMTLSDSITSLIPTLERKIEHYEKDKESIRAKYIPLYEEIIPLDWYR